MWQECKLCKRKVKPENLRPLLYSGSSAGQKPHEQELCEMCQELGHNSRDAPEVSAGGDGGGDDDDDDDDRSVYSEASTSSSSSVDDRNLHNITPVASEDEDGLGKRLDTATKLDD